MPVFRLCLGLGHTPLSGTVQVFGAPPSSLKTGAVQSCDSWSSCDGEGLAVMVQSILPPGGCATGGWPGDFIPVLWMGFCPEHQCPELFRENETQLQQTSITVLSEEAVMPVLELPSRCSGFAECFKAHPWQIWSGWQERMGSAGGGTSRAVHPHSAL